MKKTLLLTLLFYVSFACASEKKNQGDKSINEELTFNSLVPQYGIDQVLGTCLLFYDLKNVFLAALKNDTTDFYRFENHSPFIKTLEENLKREIVIHMDQYLSLLPASESQKLFREFENCCQVYVQLNYLVFLCDCTLDGFLDILFKSPKLADHLLEKGFVNEMDLEVVTSISSSLITPIYYESIFFISKLDKEEQVETFTLFFEELKRQNKMSTEDKKP